jgi:L-ascorbate metabolism protein UlaG (beta-lactamase superfamily)
MRLAHEARADQPYAKLRLVRHAHSPFQIPAAPQPFDGLAEMAENPFRKQDTTAKPIGGNMQIAWLGHSAFHLEMAGKDILIDPFFTDNPTYPQGYADGLDKVDYIVITHGHADHIGDAADLVRKHRSTVVSMFEICQYLAAQGAENIEPMNIGGTVTSGGIDFSMVNAQHSSALIEDGGRPLTMGDPAGYVLKSEGRSIYHMGDTEIFSDLALIQRIHKPDTAFIPIGDRFTMGPKTAAMAVNEFLDVETIVPIHWGTFPLLTGTPDAFALLVKRGNVLRPEPGDVFEI